MVSTSDSESRHPGDTETEPGKPSLADITRVSLKVGLLSFGGPAAQISVMHREFVETRKWLSEDRFLHALSYCMLLPGPEAQQLATYCGWLCGRITGGLVAGLLFILPGAVAMAAVSYVYVVFGNVPAVSALFYGIKAGVLAIVLQALLRIGKKALKNRLDWTICGLSFCALFFLSVPFPLVIASAAGLGLLFGQASHMQENADEPRTEAVSFGRTLRLLAVGVTLWAVPPLAAVILLAPDNVYTNIAGFFSLLAAVSFGGAYALLAYMAQVAVEGKGWLSAGEMLDGLGLAETTPGPLILVTQFVGFLGGWRDPAPFRPTTGALLAAAMTTWVTFAPSFLFVLAGAPWMERLRGNAHLAKALSAITAAVAGTIVNLAVWFALHVLFRETETVTAGVLRLVVPDLSSLDPMLAAIALTAGLLIFAAGWGMVPVLAISALLGGLVALLPGWI
ncbi:chromate efflux transporter [Rhodobacterales bacterium]|nr:chromate efflux transporter [Rhodobacterales bacterium]